MSSASPLCPQEGQKLRKLVVKHEKNPESRPYFPANMTMGSTLQTTLTRSLICLTQAEFTKVMGVRPRAKDPKIPSIRLEDVDGTPTTFYVFQDEQQPWRRLSLSASSKEEVQQQVLSHDDHLHEGQPAEFRKQTFDSRARSSGQLHLTHPQSAQSLSTISEYKAVWEFEMCVLVPCYKETETKRGKLGSLWGPLVR